MTDTANTAWEALPETVRDYLTAHRTNDVAAALERFAPAAEVTDEGHTFRGHQQIATWLNTAGSEYTYTTEFTGATATDNGHVDVVQRLVGNFPGGVADLHYRFTLDGPAITELVIEP